MPSFLIIFAALFDFESFLNIEQSNCIENVVQINLQNAPGAYNASVIPCDQGYLVAFRTDEYIAPLEKNIKTYKNFIGLCKLDENFAASDFCKIQLQLGCMCYDPRLFEYQDQIWIIFGSANEADPDACSSSRLNLAKIKKNGDEYYVDRPIPLYIKNQNLFEKNWVPFVYKNKLLLSYYLEPHTSVYVDVETGECRKIFSVPSAIKWEFGDIRGGTPSIKLEDGCFLNFFHTQYFKNENCFYIMGACVFLGKPPFRVLKISKRPLFHGNFYSSPKNPNVKAYVVYPSGVFIQNDKIYVSYGENDSSIKMIIINKNHFFQEMFE